MSDLESMYQDHELWQLFVYAHRLISSAGEKTLLKYGLSYNTVSLLAALSHIDHDPMPVELARGGKRKPQTVTSTLNRMEKQGLLKRTRDEQRKNTFRVSLTEKGKMAYQKAATIDVYHNVMSSLSEERRAQLRACLEELIASASKYC